MPLPPALYHITRLSEQIPADPSPSQSANWLWRYPSFSPADSYGDATAASHIPFDLSQRADSNEGLPDPGECQHGELPLF